MIHVLIQVHSSYICYIDIEHLLLLLLSLTPPHLLIITDDWCRRRSHTTASRRTVTHGNCTVTLNDHPVSISNGSGGKRDLFQVRSRLWFR